MIQNFILVFRSLCVDLPCCEEGAENILAFIIAKRRISKPPMISPYHSITWKLECLVYTIKLHGSGRLDHIQQ